jgi:hypothetical protein
VDENFLKVDSGTVMYRQIFPDGRPKGAWNSTLFSQGGGSQMRKVVKGGLRRKPKGWLFPTAYSFEQETHVKVNGRCWHRRSDGTYDEAQGALSSWIGGPNNAVNQDPTGSSGSYAPSLYPNVDHVSQAEAKALNGLLTHGRDLDGTFNVGQAWAERKETVSLLTGVASTLAQVGKDLRAGKPGRAFRNLFPNGSRSEFKKFRGSPYMQWYRSQQKKAVKSIKASPAMAASGFLSLQNGWKPLLNDVHNAAEALANRKSVTDWVITGKGYLKIKKVGSQSPDMGINPQNTYTHDQLSIQAVFVRLDARVTDEHLHKLAQLGLNNPAALAWETTRLTYLVDYFIAIGDWLKSLGAADGLTFYSGSCTRYCEYVSVLKSNSTSGRVKFSGSRRYVKWTRDAYVGFPVPIAPLSLKPQELKTTQIFNLLSVFYLSVTGQPIPYARA